MRLMLFTHSYAPESSPPQRRWGAFTDVLVERGWTVDVVTPLRGDSSSSITQSAGSALASHNVAAGGSVQVHRFRAPYLNRSWVGKLVSHLAVAVIMIPKSFAAPRPDVLLATVPALPTLFAAFLVSKVRRVPLVVEMRDAWPELIRESGVARWKWLECLAIGAIHFVQRRAALVIAVSEGQQNALRRSGVRRSEVITNGYDFENAVMVSRNPLRENEKLRVLYLGNLGESQGLEIAITAASLASENIELRIVGTGTALERLKGLREASAQNIAFFGTVRGRQVREMYEWADTCLVSLRPDWESFSYTIPSKLYELMALGCHVTGLVQGDAAEIIVKTSSGVVLPQDASSLAEYWKSNESREDIDSQSNQGDRRPLHNYNLGSLGNKYSEILLKVIHETK